MTALRKVQIGVAAFLLFVLIGTFWVFSCDVFRFDYGKLGATATVVATASVGPTATFKPSHSTVTRSVLTPIGADTFTLLYVVVWVRALQVIAWIATVMALLWAIVALSREEG